MDLKRNIPLYYASSCLGWARFYMPVLALFYIASQVTIQEMSIILSVFFAAIIILEVPTGVLADLLGRKNSMLLSRCFYLVEIYILAFHNGFTLFLIAKLFSAVGVALNSGSGEALFYDTFKAMGRESEFKKYNANLHMVTQLSMALMMTLGSILFYVHHKLPAIVSIPFAIAGIVVVSMLKEPVSAPKRLTVKNAFNQMHEGLRYVAKHKHLKYLILFSFPLVAFMDATLGFSSLHHKLIHIPVPLIGIIATIASLLTAVAAKKSHLIEVRYGAKKVMLVMQLAMLGAMFMLSFMIPYLGVLFYFIIPIVYGFYKVLIQDYTNIHTESSHRATILSIKNLFDSLAITLWYLVFGYYAEISLGKAFLVGFGIYVFLFILTKFYEKKKNI